jgi:inner membrane protein
VASVITHPAVPIAIALALGRKIIPVPLLVLGVAFSVIPDLDGIAFRLGIPYGSPFGHRGFSHSIAFALLMAALAAPFAKTLRSTPIIVFSFLAISMASHGVLDAMTDAGKGVAFLWPWSAERFFFDFRPIEASPVSVRRFLAGRGLEVLQSELVWVWQPAAVLGTLVAFARKMLVRANAPGE